jgi:hypothetical protein
MVQSAKNIGTIGQIGFRPEADFTDLEAEGMNELHRYIVEND